MPRTDHLLESQRRLLMALATVGGDACDDGAVAAWAQVDRSLVTRWRRGERPAPLGLLGYLDTLPVDVLAAVLRAWTSDRSTLTVGVVEDTDPDTDEDELVGRVVDLAGRVARARGPRRREQLESAGQEALAIGVHLRVCGGRS